MPFKWVISHFGFLKNVQPLPFVFDAFLSLSTAVFYSNRMHLISRLEDELASWEGVSKGFHKYGGIQFNYRKRELGHIHSNGVTDIFLSKTLKKEVLSKNLAEEHHTLINSNWVTIFIKKEEDFQNALIVFEEAYSRCGGSG